jgi:hypothetical protein
LTIELDAGEKLSNLVVTDCKTSLCWTYILQKPLFEIEGCGSISQSRARKRMLTVICVAS